MRVYRVLAVAVLFLFLVGLGFGQDNRRAQPFSFQSGVQTLTFCDCGDFLVMEDWVDSVHGVMIYDEDGTTIRQVMNTTFGRTDIFYNANDPELFLVGGPGEGQNFRFEFEDGILYMTGLFNRIMIPGYGRIMIQTGRMVVNLQTGEMVSATDHRVVDQIALCDLLRPKQP